MRRSVTFSNIEKEEIVYICKLTYMTLLQ